MAQEPVYILSDIVKRLGDASEDEVRLEFEGLSNSDFVAKGRRIGTPRLAKELARNYGMVANWLLSATPAQLDLLGFISNDWLRLAAWAARKAELNYESLKKGDSKSSADKELRTAKADELLKQAKNARDRLRMTLLHLAGGIPAWVQRVESAYAVPETQAPVADSLVALCDIAGEMLADKSAGMKTRKERSKLDAAAIKKHRELAIAAAGAVREAAAVAPASPVTQSDVDLWDGIAITFFEQFVEAIEQAREEDPTIPGPSIIGLRGWFRRLSRKERSEAGADGGESEEGGAEHVGGG